MPQLDPSSYVSQIFWLAVTFLCLWFVMSLFIIPKIKDVIDEREQKIEDYIQKAERINQKANEVLMRYEESLSQAKIETEAQMKKELLEFDQMLQKKQDETDELLKQRIASNEILLKKEREETLQMTEEISQKTAQVILKKLGFDVKTKDQNE